MCVESPFCVWFWSGLVSCVIALVVMVYYTIKCCRVMHSTTAPSSHCRHRSPRGTHEQRHQRCHQDPEAPPPSYAQLYPNSAHVMPYIPVVHMQLQQQDIMSQQQAMQSEIQYTLQPPRVTMDGVNYFDMQI